MISHFGPNISSPPFGVVITQPLGFPHTGSQVGVVVPPPFEPPPPPPPGMVH